MWFLFQQAELQGDEIVFSQEEELLENETRVRFSY